MNYVKSLNLLGKEAKEIPCIVGNGVPTTSTEGAVGCLYMDAQTSVLYKCTSIVGSTYNWGLVVDDSFDEDSARLLIDTILSESLEAGLSEAIAQMQSNVSNTTSELNTRVNNLIANNNNSENNSELVDIRVAANGKTYNSAGDAVRQQFNDVKKDTDVQTVVIDDYEIGDINASGASSVSPYKLRTPQYYYIDEIKEVITDGSIKILSVFYDATSAFTGSVGYVSTSFRMSDIDIPDNSKYCRFVFYRDSIEITDVDEFKSHIAIRKYTNTLRELKLLKNNYNEINFDFPHIGYIDKFGVLNTSLSSYSTTDFIRVENKICLKGFLGRLNNSVCYINCYTIEKDYISGIEDLRGDGGLIECDYTEYELPANTAYIRLTIISSLTHLIKLYTTPIYYTNPISLTFKTINGIPITGEGDINTSFKETNVVYNSAPGYISKTDGVFKSLNNYYTTDFIEVSPEIMVDATFSNLKNQYYFNCYNKHKTYIGGIELGDSTGSVVEYNQQTIQLLDGTQYIRITNSAADKDTVKVYIMIGSSENQSENQFENQIDNALLDFSAFRKFGVIGDSLSVGHMSNTDNRNIWYSWGQYLARSIGNTCLNFGRSGATCASWWTDSKCKPVFDKSENLCQAYIVGLGTNDKVASGEVSLGTISDIDWNDYNNNQASFYGQYARILQYIREKATLAPIFVFTLPHPRTEENKNAAIKEIVQSGNISNVYLVDLAASEYDYCFKTILPKYANNGHFTAIGYKHIATMINIAISKVIRENLNNFKETYSIPYGSNDIVQ